MIYFSNKKRSTQDEIMDDFELQGAEMQKLLTDLKTVNTLLGGTGVTLDGIDTLLKTESKSKQITITDIGCGDGELLRNCYYYLTKKGYNVKAFGIDANKNIIEEAIKRTKTTLAIEYQVVDVFSKQNNIPQSDIMLCTLFLHHFDNESITRLVTRMLTQTHLGIVVNDLHRSVWAFRLFKIFSYLFIKTKIARHDGLVSVARGFKKEELQSIASNISASKNNISWKWAFRYQWIIFQNKN